MHKKATGEFCDQIALQGDEIVKLEKTLKKEQEELSKLEKELKLVEGKEESNNLARAHAISTRLPQTPCTGPLGFPKFAGGLSPHSIK